jgi:hypothetical protein
VNHFNCGKLLTLIAGIVLLSACGPNETILKSNSPTPMPADASATPYTSNDPVDKEVDAMRTANFNYIFVLRRKDGAKLTADDIALVRGVTGGFNRRTLSDDEKAVIVGSNPRVPDDTMQMIRSRFDVEDFSKPASEIPNNNAAANANMNR